MNILERKRMGMRIKECRQKANLSQEELAQKLDMKRTNIANYEAGRVIPPGNILLKLADIFGVSTDYLLGLSDTPYPESVELDEDIRQIQRAAKRMTNEQRKRMLEIVKLSFIDAFNEDDEEDDADDL